MILNGPQVVQLIPGPEIPGDERRFSALTYEQRIGSDPSRRAAETRAERTKRAVTADATCLHP
jgi:hypothetical protein